MEQVDLQATLMGGQCFAWEEKDGVYSAVLKGKQVSLSCAEDIQGPFLSDYFDMSFDYKAAREYLATLSPVLDQAVTTCPGLHILRQDPYLVTINFLLSQNNNIKRIKALYDTLCRSYGTEVSTGRFSFPTRDQLSKATEKELLSLKFGYRSGYIVSVVREYGRLGGLEKLSTAKARERLMTLRGIGPKVADCILVFGYHRWDAFPMDTWMRKVMCSYFPNKDGSYFAPYQALAQQYLFQSAQSGRLVC
ncbi:MAG: DNA glycosylase [Sphaerochaetaceae bacterium]